MEGSSRIQRDTLDSPRLCSRTTIIHNKGFKNCEKESCIDTPMLDLWHAFKTVCAISPGRTSLILEDDYIVVGDNLQYIPRVEQFIATHNCDIYSLGSNPMICIPTFGSHVRILLGGAAHAWIVTPYAKQYILSQNDMRSRTAHDLEYSKRLRMFTFRVPIIVQPHPVTENMLGWSDGWPKALRQQHVRRVLENVMRRVLTQLGAERDGRNLYNAMHGTMFVGGSIPFGSILVAVVIASIFAIFRLTRTPKLSNT